MGILLTSASPAEVTLIEETLDEVLGQQSVDGEMDKLIYDKAADSDTLRLRLRERGIELVCPHRKNRKKRPLQDGRALRRYRRRWKIERTIAWLGNYRRLVVRYERNPRMYLTFAHIACALIALARL